MRIGDGTKKWSELESICCCDSNKILILEDTISDLLTRLQQLENIITNNITNNNITPLITGVNIKPSELFIAEGTTIENAFDPNRITITTEPEGFDLNDFDWSFKSQDTSKILIGEKNGSITAVGEYKIWGSYGEIFLEIKKDEQILFTSDPIICYIGYCDNIPFAEILSGNATIEFSGQAGGYTSYIILIRVYEPNLPIQIKIPSTSNTEIIVENENPEIEVTIDSVTTTELISTIIPKEIINGNIIQSGKTFDFSYVQKDGIPLHGARKYIFKIEIAYDI